jgi:hypothetical protein
MGKRVDHIERREGYAKKERDGRGEGGKKAEKRDAQKEKTSLGYIPHFGMCGGGDTKKNKKPRGNLKATRERRREESASGERTEERK